jgi:hypothetical protein
VLPLLVLALGLVLLVGGWFTLRSMGPRLRVGRLIGATPAVSVADARAIAAAGERRYVAVRGRVDSDREFEDADHRPLVLRRTRLQLREAGGWRTWEDNRDVVPFEIRDGLVSIGVDGERLDDGLVVVPRESAGVAADLADRVPAGTPPDAPVRVRIEQVSSVEHALVLGVPENAEGGPRLTAGLGRPLVLTTLEPREAMRIIAEGRTGAPRAAAILLGAGVAVTLVGLGWLLIELVL